MHVCARFTITANYHKSNTMLLQILPRYSMLFILFTADSMGVSESLEGMYLQNLCQVIKSSVCPQKDRSTGAERVSLRNNASLIPLFCRWMVTALAYSVPFNSYCWLSVEFSSVWLFVHAPWCIFCGSSWHHMCGVYVVLHFYMFEELTGIFNLIFYLMV